MSDAHNAQDQNRFHTNLSVGEILRRTRCYHNLDLGQVSADLRIRMAQLDAIERSAYDELPGRVYAIGFIRNYAEYLGLDGEKIIHIFKTQEGGKQTEPELNFPVPASESRIPGYKTLSAVALLLIGMSIAWSWLVRADNTAVALSIPQVPDALEKKVSKARGKGVVNVPENFEDVPSPDKGREGRDTFKGNKENKENSDKDGAIILRAKADVWLEIRNARDEVILSDILTKGERYRVPDNKNGDLVMTTGNAGGLAIEFNGQKLNGLGAPGEVKRGIKLEAGALKAFSKQQ